MAIKHTMKIHLKIILCYRTLCLNDRANTDIAYMLRIDNLKSMLHWDYFQFKIYPSKNIVQSIAVNKII
jgi:hypothetical protein